MEEQHPSKVWVESSSLSGVTIYMKLETLILQTLAKVRDHELNVMEAFDILSKRLSDEFDEIHDKWLEEIENFD